MCFWVASLAYFNFTASGIVIDTRMALSVFIFICVGEKCSLYHKKANNNDKVKKNSMLYTLYALEMHLPCTCITNGCLV